MSCFPIAVIACLSNFLLKSLISNVLFLYSPVSLYLLSLYNNKTDWHTSDTYITAIIRQEGDSRGWDSQNSQIFSCNNVLDFFFYKNPFIYVLHTH